MSIELRYLEGKLQFRGKIYSDVKDEGFTIVREWTDVPSVKKEEPRKLADVLENVSCEPYTLIAKAALDRVFEEIDSFFEEDDNFYGGGPSGLKHHLKRALL